MQWQDGEAERDWACLTVLAEHAPGLAPRPLRRETMEDGSPVVVMERVRGTPLGDGPLTDAQTTTLGDGLRRLWDVSRESVVAAGLLERRYGPTVLAVVLRGRLGDDHDLADCRDPVLVREGVDAAGAWLARDDLPEPRLESLGISLLNPANVLWDGAACRLVGFEDGGLTDPAYELADHVEHLAGRGVYDVDALVGAIGLSDEHRERMSAYRSLWACFWLVMLLPGNGASTATRRGRPNCRPGGSWR